MQKWSERIKNLVFNIASMQIPVYAANACYFLAIAVFPALLLILASLRYTPLSATDLIRLLEGILPTALMGAAESLIVSTYYNSSGAILSVSAVTALWSASRGIFGLLTGLNHIYGVREDRGYFYTRFISVVYTFVFLLMILLSLVLQVFGPTVLDQFVWTEHPFIHWLIEMFDDYVQYLWVLAIQTMVCTLIYRVLPNRRNSFFGSLPGAVVAALGWQGFTFVFGFYVERANYTSIYGSVYTIATAMLWLYFCISILLFGGGLNRLLQQWRRK